MSATLEYFFQISKIPRPSKKEERIREYVASWASDRGYSVRTDGIGNLAVSVPASPGREGENAVVLQSHMDMVCVKVPGSGHDFDRDPIVPIEENGWMKASGTTLGADNGIGMALSMAACGFASRPPIELLLTVDEERGMSGALSFDPSILTGRRVVNLDSEDEGEICLSSSGGAGIVAKREFVRHAGAYPQYALRLFGMRGGHSGVEIHENR